MTHRPCGACGELVPVVVGCQHWRPRSGSRDPGRDRRNQLNRERNQRMNERLAELRAQRS